MIPSLGRERISARSRLRNSLAFGAKALGKWARGGGFVDLCANAGSSLAPLSVSDIFLRANELILLISTPRQSPQKPTDHHPGNEQRHVPRTSLSLRKYNSLSKFHPLTVTLPGPLVRPGLGLQPLRYAPRPPRLPASRPGQLPVRQQCLRAEPLRDQLPRYAPPAPPSNLLGGQSFHHAQHSANSNSFQGQNQGQQPSGDGQMKTSSFTRSSTQEVSDSGREKTNEDDDEDPETKRQRFLERNRIAGNPLPRVKLIPPSLQV